MQRARLPLMGEGKSASPVVAAILAVTLMLGWILPAAAQTTASFSRDESERLFAEGYAKIVDLYLRPVDLGALTMAGLNGLSQIDPRLVVTRNHRSIRVQYGDTTVGAFFAPQDNDPDAWAETTTGVLDLAQTISPVLHKTSVGDLHKTVFDSLLSGLDKFSRYAGALTAEDHRAAREGFGGIGVRIEVEDEGVRVIEVLPSTPAYRVHMQPDDLITHIENRSVRGWSQGEVVRHLRGPVQTIVRLTIDRRGFNRPFSVSLTRDQIFLRTVIYRPEGDVAYIKLSSFNQRTAQALREAMEQARRDIRHLKGFILDLRGNPGGLLDQAVAVSDMFIERGLILSTRGRHPESLQVFHATSNDLAQSLPVVTLVNGASASAAEIVAAALQDRARSAVIGATTFGKGSVQTVIQLPNDGELTLTWARLHAPSGYSFHELGVVPSLCTAKGQAATQDLIAAARRQIGRVRSVRAASVTGGRPTLTQINAVREDCAWEANTDAYDMQVALDLLHSPSLYNQVLNLSKTAVATAGRDDYRTVH